MAEILTNAKETTTQVVSGTTELVGSTFTDLMVTVDNFLSKVSSNQYVFSFVVIFFVAYGSSLGSGGKPPKFVLDMFKNPITRVLLLTIVAYEVNKNLTISILIALAFYLTQQYVFQQESFEQIKNLEKFQNMYYLNKAQSEKKN
jgi:formate/nitrite transporter FocA (FNT family)